MNVERRIGALITAALAFTFGACGSDPDEQVGSADGDDRTTETTADTTTTSQVQRTTPMTAADTSTPADEAGTTGTTADTTVDTTAASPSDVTLVDESDDVVPASCAEAPEEWRDVIAGAAPPAPAPGGLADAELPTDSDAVLALFGALPDELIGGVKTLGPPRSGLVVEVDYEIPDRASRDGFQAIDLETDMMGSILPEPRADMLVALFVLSDDDDYTVDAAGHDGDLYWVTFVGTNSGEGIDGIEEVHTIVWGEACSPLAFIAAAPTDSSRDELIAAFIEVATTVPA